MLPKDRDQNSSSYFAPSYRSSRGLKRVLTFYLGILPLALSLFHCSSPGGRPHFVRDFGGYHPTPPPGVLKPSDPLPLTRISSGKFKRIAESYLGVPYRYGGTNRGGMDCSGYIHTVFRQAYGVQLPHRSASLFRLGKRVRKTSLRPGDLVFFGRLGSISHSGIYMGNGRFLHASSTNGVIYSGLHSPYYQKRFQGARRLVPLS